MFKYSDSNKRYHTLDYYYKQKYGTKIMKISLNGNFSCPNLDGTVGYGGCIYCSKTGSGEFAGKKEDSIQEQFIKVKEKMNNKWKEGKYIAYFQARTNTYAPTNRLKELYEEALKQENVVGINIATRPDSIKEDCLDYLEELNKKTDVTIELGLQSIKEETSKLINRCHSLECFEKMVKKLRERNIPVVVHIINGLPYETKEEMIETVKYLNHLKIDGIKIHMLSVVKDTELADIYEKEKFPLLNKEEYIDIIVEQLCYLDPQICIHRITGDPVSSTLIAPLWLTKKFVVLNDIDKEMVRRNVVQGCKLI